MRVVQESLTRDVLVRLEDDVVESGASVICREIQTIVARDCRVGCAEMVNLGGGCRCGKTQNGNKGEKVEADHIGNSIRKFREIVGGPG